MLRVKNCESGYGKLRVLKGVSLHVAAGEIVTIIGANGAGKTTLLHTIAGIVRPRSGEIVFNGRESRGAAPHAIAGRGCCLVPEGRRIFAPMTVDDNLTLGAYTQFRKRNALIRQKGTGAGVRTVSRCSRSAGSSLPERFRAGSSRCSPSAGRSWAIRASIMLDEPSTGLAPLVVKSIFRRIAELRRSRA